MITFAPESINQQQYERLDGQPAKKRVYIYKGKKRVINNH